MSNWEKTEGQKGLEQAEETDQYFWADSDGAHISSTGDHDTSGFHQLLTSVKNAFMHGTDELMTISADLIELGKNSASAIISMCSGHFEVRGNDLGATLQLKQTDQPGTYTFDLIANSNTGFKHLIHMGRERQDYDNNGQPFTATNTTLMNDYLGLNASNGSTIYYPISMLQNALTNTSTSTTETPVGTWIDGKTIYRKCINIGTVTTSSTGVIPHNIANLGRFTRVYGIARDSTPVQFTFPYTNGTASAYVYAGASGVVVGQVNLYLYDCVAILEYTKA